MAGNRLKEKIDVPIIKLTGAEDESALQPSEMRESILKAVPTAPHSTPVMEAPRITANQKPANDASPTASVSRPPSYKWPIRAAFGVAAIAIAGLALQSNSKGEFGIKGLLEHYLPGTGAHANPNAAAAPAVKPSSGPISFRPTDAHWQTLTVAPVEPVKFRETVSTDGKISINEDRTTPVFSPNTGLVLKLMVKLGDQVKLGTPLFTIKANDMVGAQNDYLAANSALNTARSAVDLAQKKFSRAKALYEAKAGPLKDYQEAEDGYNAAKNGQKTAEVALQANRNRLLILGKSDQDVTALITQGQISSEITVNSPIAGTIVQRKVGPGQLLGSGSTDPVYIIGDLGTVWLIANVRESDAIRIKPGQAMEFTTVAIPNKVFTSKITYVSPAVDPASRRIQVRAEIDNPGVELKPEMFANVTIVTSGDAAAVGVPRSGLIYEGSDVRAWVARDDKTIELRKIEVGLVNGEFVQVLKGLTNGEKVITKGSLFIDRIAKLKE